MSYGHVILLNVVPCPLPSCFKGILYVSVGSGGKASVYDVGDSGSIPGSGRFLGEGNSNPLQYYCLENPMDRGAQLHYYILYMSFKYLLNEQIYNK